MFERQLGWRSASALRTSGPRIYRATLLLIIINLVAACGGGGGGGGGRQAEPAAATPDPAPTSTTPDESSDSAPSSETPEPAPSMAFSASATTLTVGQSVTLSWQSSNADSCLASGGWSGARALAGSETVGPLQQSQTFVLSCSGKGGGALREVMVNVEEQKDIAITLASSADVVLLNGQVELGWSVSNADRCEASGDWSGQKAFSGAYETPPLTENATYKLTCFANGQSAIALVSVEVTDKTIRWQAPTENTDGSPVADLAGFNIYWGENPRSYTDSVSLGPEAREWVADLDSGTYYIAMTAIDAESNESGYSNELRKVIP